MDKNLTPKQEKFLEEFLSRPVGARIFEVFGLETIASKEQLRNEEIVRRVEGFLEQQGLAPKEPRRVEVDRKPWDAPDLSGYKEGECPF
jgi:hypothetical protein